MWYNCILKLFDRVNEPMFKVIKYKDKKGEWRWHMKAHNGAIVAESGEGYENKGAMNHILNTIARVVQTEQYIIEEEEEPRE